MNEVYWGTLILLATFISRWWPRLVEPSAVGTDTFYHLMQAEYLRKNGFKLHKNLPNFVLPGEYAYPPIYHYILAIFSQKMREEFEKVSSALFDTTLVALFYILATRMLRPMGWDVLSVFLFSLAFALNPGLVSVSTGPRAYQGTPRTLGELLTAISFTSLWQFLLTQNWLFMVFSLILGSLTFNTSKFSSQVLLFFSLFIAFILNSATLLIFPFICVLGAIIVSKGHYWRILKHQINHLHIYATRLVTSHPTTRARLSWYWPKSIKEVVRFIIYDNLIGLILLKFFVPLIVVGLILWNAVINDSNYDIDPFLLSWLISAFVVFLIVSTPRFVFIGEAERYLEYALIPAFLIFGILLTDDNTRLQIITTVLLLFILLYIFYTFFFIFRYRRKANADLSNLVDVLNNHEPTRILSIIDIAPWELAYRSHHQFVFSESVSTSEEEFDYFFWRYPLPRSNIKYLIKEYNVGLIAASKYAISSSRGEGCVYDFSGLLKIFENGDFILYEIPKGYLNLSLEF